MKVCANRSPSGVPEIFLLQEWDIWQSQNAAASYEAQCAHIEARQEAEHQFCEDSCWQLQNHSRAPFGHISSLTSTFVTERPHL